MFNILIIADQARRSEGEKLKSQLAARSWAVSVADPDFLKSKFDPTFQIIVIAAGERGGEILSGLRGSGWVLPVIVFADGLDFAISYKAVRLGRAKIAKDSAELLALLEDLSKAEFLLEQQLVPYLTGISPELKLLKQKMAALALTSQNLFLYGEAGLGQHNIAEWFHQKSCFAGKNLLELNLNNFTREDYEVHVWAALKEAYQNYETELPGFAETLTGTIFLRGLENKDILFVISVLEWLHEKSTSLEANRRLNLRVIVEITSAQFLEALIKDFQTKYVLLQLVPLRERREDLVSIINKIIVQDELRVSGKLMDLELKLLEIWSAYNWPGNIDELRYNLALISFDNKNIFINKGQLFDYLNCQLTAGLAPKSILSAIKDLKKE